LSRVVEFARARIHGEHGECYDRLSSLIDDVSDFQEEFKCLQKELEKKGREETRMKERYGENEDRDGRWTGRKQE